MSSWRRSSSWQRRPTRRDDAPAIAALVTALDVAVLGRSDYSLAELHDEWRELDVERDSWIVEGEGGVAGYGTVEQHGDHWRIDGYVAPAAWGRGVGRLLVDELEAEARARGARRVQNAVLVLDTRAQELLTARGYRELRRFQHMRIVLDSEPEPPVWPDGLAVGRFDERDAAAFHAALEEAFADHWEWEALAHEDWRRQELEREGHDPSLWTVVRDGGEIVAGTVCLPERLGAGWVARVFTRRSWRGRGIGEALVRQAFRDFWERGQPLVGLGVDGQSTTGANRLYERLGMRVHWGAVVFEKELAG
jgi:ribosomal protein S18 acetylase RimI-like enzyme